MTHRLCPLVVLATLALPPAAHAASGTWAVDDGGNWSDAAKWTGGTIADGADFTANFTNDVSATRIVALDTDRTIGNLTFSDNGAAGTTRYLVSTGTFVLTLATSSGTPTINTISNASVSAWLGGNQGLRKTGPAGLSLGGSVNRPNIYSGGTTISGGSLGITSDGALGDPSGGITIDGGTFLTPASSPPFTSARSITLTTAGTNTIRGSGGTSIFSGTISGAGGVTFAGGSAVVLSGSNTYQGDTALNMSGGFLRAVDGVGLPAASNLVLQNGTFQSSGAFTRSLGVGAGQVRWVGSGTASGIGFSAFGGPLVVQIGGDTNTLTWGSENFVSGTLALSGPDADNLVDFQNGLDLAGGTRTIRVWDEFDSSSDLAQISGPISNGDLTKLNAGTLILSGTNSYGNTTIAAVGGTLQVGDGGTTGTLGGGSITFAGDTIANSLAFNRSDEYTVDATITSDATNNSIVQKGTGTTTLTGTMSGYSGSFSVSAGRLLLNSTVGGAGAVTVDGGTFGGTGSVSGTVTVNNGGRLAPGAQIGTLQTGTVVLASGGTMSIEADLSDSMNADLLMVTGTTMLDSSTLYVSLTDAPPVLPPTTFMVIDNDGVDVVTGMFGSVLGLPAGYAATVDYAYSGTDALGRVGTGNDVAMTLVAVPEPGTIVLLLIAGVCCRPSARTRLVV